MLPTHLKLSSPTEFSRVLRHGRKAGSKTVVVHYFDETELGNPPVRSGGPRFGLVVSKAVGNAVIRKRTSRRLRHIAFALAPQLPPTARIVLRALPAAGQAESDRLKADIQRGLRKVRRP